MIFEGKIQKGNLVVFNSQSMKDYIESLNDKSVLVYIKEKGNIRTLEANAYYWGYILAIIEDETGMDKYKLHEFFKLRFNPVWHQVFDPVTKRLIEKRTVGGSTRKMSVKAFKKYIDEIKIWSTTELNILWHEDIERWIADHPQEVIRYDA
jgi:hypothetical protein